MFYTATKQIDFNKLLLAFPSLFESRLQPNDMSVEKLSQQLFRLSENKN